MQARDCAAPRRRNRKSEKNAMFSAGLMPARYARAIAGHACECDERIEP
ncbi:hypothetical protein LC55x_3111 [Lysobacter capsici]|nr:hypothetical protein LC55x_3111 [Lysobacter capsici]